METSKNYFDSVEKTKYKITDFDYTLPQSKIAQYPLTERDACKLMVVNRETGEVSHRKFSEIVQYLHAGDCLVLNDTSVFPARLHGRKDKTDARVEIFLLRQLDGYIWETLVKPARKVRIGNKIHFSENLSCDVIDNTLSGGRIVEFSSNGNFYELLSEVGETPLPPYIKRQPDETDKIYYQTVFAKRPGAVAAPTAGLHFTEALLKKIRKKGVKIAYTTLHAGLGTFRPVQVEDVSRHHMDAEYYEISAEAVEIINRTREKGKAIIAVGTTTVRALETVTDHRGFVRPSRGWTDKYIYPPHDFKIVDRLITNFHLPKSTLLMLVSAFSSLDMMKAAYREAIKTDYRFFSYGDAMYII